MVAKEKTFPLYERISIQHLRNWTPLSYAKEKAYAIGISIHTNYYLFSCKYYEQGDRLTDERYFESFSWDVFENHLKNCIELGWIDEITAIRTPADNRNVLWS